MARQVYSSVVPDTLGKWDRFFQDSQRADQVMKPYDALPISSGVDYGKNTDLARTIFHEIEGLFGHLIRQDGNGIAGHDV